MVSVPRYSASYVILNVPAVYFEIGITTTVIKAPLKLDVLARITYFLFLSKYKLIAETGLERETLLCTRCSDTIYKNLAVKLVWSPNAKIGSIN